MGLAAPPHLAGRAETTVALIVAVASGALIAVQARINSELGSDLDQPLLASVISNGGGLVVLVAAYLLRRRTRENLRRALGSGLPWWRFLGGAFGAVLVAGGPLLVPTLGVALFTVGMVAGQTAGGIGVDRVGLAPGGRRPITPVRLLGAALAIVAVGVAESGGSGGQLSVPLVLAAAGLGLSAAIQTAINGSVRQAADDPVVATTINFVVGTAALLIVYGLVVAGAGPHVARWPGDWWLYIGGLLGIGIVSAGVFAVRSLGVLRVVLSVIAGQLTAAVVLDAVVPTRGSAVDAGVVAGVVLTFIAVAVAGRAPRRLAG
ncbi:MAG TPA: DMT family transporter [Mycobacteriales bacterium]|nr:DMT family transporter [Mycobacteriales bacterium]